MSEPNDNNSVSSSDTASNELDRISNNEGEIKVQDVTIPDVTSTDETTITTEGTKEKKKKKNHTAVVDMSTIPLDWTKLGQQQQVKKGKDDGGGESNDGDGSQQQQQHDEIPIRYPFDVADITMDETDVCLVGTAGQKITNMGPDFSKHCHSGMKSLIFRSHMIKKMEGLQYFTELELLELYDNQIVALNSLNQGLHGSPGQTLRVLDMSFNSIRDMQPVEYCPNLEELYLANNKIKELAGLKGLSKLRKLDLGANRIRIMDTENLSGLINLEELWFGKNKVEMITGLEKLTKLRRLDVQSNRLTTIENICHPQLLEEMYFAHNAITSNGISFESGIQQEFPNLLVLDLSRNLLTTTEPLKHLTSLDELWISGNKIESMENVEPLRSLGSSLQTIYLEYNPVQKSEPLYRIKIAEMIPSLIQIDAYMISGNPHKPLGLPPPPAAAAVVATTSTKDLVKQITSTSVMSTEEKNRQLQDLIVQRAIAETSINTTTV